MSPSSNLGSQSFIFPIRSVFQGMAQSDSTQSVGSNADSGSRGEGSGSLSRNPSRILTPGGGRTGMTRQPVRRNQSSDKVYTGEGEDDANDAGMQTIAQMLHQGSTYGQAPRPMERNQTASSSFTFIGKQLVRDHEVGPPPQGYFSAPIDESQSKGDNMFDMRRNSVSGSVSSYRPRDRPGLPHISSGDTEKAEPTKPNNASAEDSGSGLPQQDRAPVGQPQEPVSGVNFRDRHGPSSRNRPFTTARHPSRSSTKPSGSSVEQSPTQQHDNISDHPPSEAQFDVKGSDQLKALLDRPGSSTDGSASSMKRRTSATLLEVAENGEKALVHDYSGIVRLDSLAEHDDSSRGAVSSNRDNKSGKVGTRGSKSSGPTGARLAQQQRHADISHSNDVVRNFVNDQAKTVNLSDPNAPTPSPTPTPDENGRNSPLQSLGRMGSGAGLGIQGRNMDESAGESSEASSMSVRDSSEMATASGDESKGTGDEAAPEEEEEEPPITTLRFEHISTEDGHHVVIGREGILQRCEDEPITTPGAVQGFGVLMVLEEDYDTGKLIVRQASEVGDTIKQ
jgi:hypothetical protein